MIFAAVTYLIVISAIILSGQSINVEPIVTIKPLCLIRRCSFQQISCLAHHACKSMIGCLHGCANEERCSVLCVSRWAHEDPVSQQYLTCLKRNNCFRKGKDESCPAPMTRSRPFELTPGDWTVSYGLNRKFDTWDCLVLKISADGSFTKQFSVGHGLERSIKGTFHMAGSAKYRAKYRLQETFDAVDDWFILYSDEEHALLYRCSRCEAVPVYKGAFIMTRSPNRKISAQAWISMRSALLSANVGIESIFDFTPIVQKCQVGDEIMEIEQDRHLLTGQDSFLTSLKQLDTLESHKLDSFGSEFSDESTVWSSKHSTSTEAMYGDYNIVYQERSYPLYYSDSDSQ